MFRFGNEVLNKGIHCIRPCFRENGVPQIPITFRGTEQNAIVFLCYKHCVSIMNYIAVDVTNKCLISLG